MLVLPEASCTEPCIAAKTLSAQTMADMALAGSQKRALTASVTVTPP